MWLLNALLPWAAAFLFNKINSRNVSELYRDALSSCNWIAVNNSYLLIYRSCITRVCLVLITKEYPVSLVYPLRPLFPHPVMVYHTKGELKHCNNIQLYRDYEKNNCIIEFMFIFKVGPYSGILLLKSWFFSLEFVILFN